MTDNNTIETHARENENRWRHYTNIYFNWKQISSTRYTHFHWVYTGEGEKKMSLIRGKWFFFLIKIIESVYRIYNRIIFWFLAQTSDCKNIPLDQWHRNRNEGLSFSSSVNLHWLTFKLEYYSGEVNTKKKWRTSVVCFCSIYRSKPFIMPLWDYIHIGRPNHPHHNLQEGLFQIASQTCSILVQVNNTNNISYGNNSTNVQYNNFTGHSSSSSNSDRSQSRYSSPRASSFREQSEVLIPSTSVVGNATKNLFNHYKHRLSVRNLCLRLNLLAKFLKIRLRKSGFSIKGCANRKYCTSGLCG